MLKYFKNCTTKEECKKIVKDNIIRENFKAKFNSVLLFK